MLQAQSLKQSFELLERRTRLWLGIFLALFSCTVLLNTLLGWQGESSWIALLMLGLAVAVVWFTDPFENNVTPARLALNSVSAGVLTLLLAWGLIQGADIVYWLPCLVVWFQLILPLKWANVAGVLLAISFAPLIAAMDLATRGSVAAMLFAALLVVLVTSSLAQRRLITFGFRGVDFRSACYSGAQFKTDFQKELARSQRQGTPLALVVLTTRPINRSILSSARTIQNRVCSVLIQERMTLLNLYVLDRRTMVVMMPSVLPEEKVGIQTLLDDSELGSGFSQVWFGYPSDEGMDAMVNAVDSLIEQVGSKA